MIEEQFLRVKRPVRTAGGPEWKATVDPATQMVVRFRKGRFSVRLRTVVNGAWKTKLIHSFDVPSLGPGAPMSDYMMFSLLRNRCRIDVKTKAQADLESAKRGPHPGGRSLSS